MVVQELYHFTSGGLLRGNNVGRYQWLLLQILLLLGQRLLQTHNATNATNTVNVGVTNDAATATRYFYLG
jgi:hypothetical protein